MTSKDKFRIDGLDGLRGISILLVVIGHVATTPSVLSTPTRVFIGHIGAFGVDIFFIISGFLITTLLLREENEKKTLDIKGFYRRRVFRILPAVFFYLGFVWFMTYVGHVNASPKDFIPPLLFYRNLMSHGPIEMGHFWTLSIEEQFYLFWPAVLLFVSKPNKRILMAVAIIICSPIWLHFNLVWSNGTNLNGWRTDLRLAPLITGCFLALLRQHKDYAVYLERRIFQEGWIGVVVCVLLMGSFWNPLFPAGQFNFVMPTLRSLAVVYLINYLAVNKGRGLDFAINSRVLVFFGSISYSLYLWNQFFCFHPTLTWYRVFPVNVLLAIGAAFTSYRFVEQPMLRLRAKIDRRLERASTTVDPKSKAA